MFRLIAMIALGAPLIAVSAPPRQIDWPTQLAMGPDPGGHTGAGVTPETTKTGQTGDHNMGTGGTRSDEARPAKSEKPEKPENRPTEGAKRK